MEIVVEGQWGDGRGIGAGDGGGGGSGRLVEVYR